MSNEYREAYQDGYADGTEDTAKKIDRLVEAARPALELLCLYMEIHGVIGTKARPNEAGEVAGELRTALRQIGGEG